MVALSIHMFALSIHVLQKTLQHACHCHYQKKLKLEKNIHSASEYSEYQLYIQVTNLLIAIEFPNDI